MSYLPYQINLLRSILAELQAIADYDEPILDQLYSYWLKEDIPVPLPEDEALQDSLDYLQALRDEDGLTSLKEIWYYLLDRRQQAEDRVTGMMDRIDRERICRELDAFISFGQPPRRLDLSRTTTINDPLLQFLNRSIPLSFPFHGLYQRPSTNYYQQFAGSQLDGRMYVLEFYSDLGIAAWSLGEVANKLAVIEPAVSEEDSQRGHPIDFNYDHLLDIVLEGKTVIDFSFKVGMTCWLLLTQLDHHGWMQEGRRLASLMMPIENPPNANALFECWVYFFLVDILADKDWSILKPPDNLSWVTSDKPGVVIDTQSEATKPIISENQLRQLKGIRSFYYPLSKDYCLRLVPSTKPHDLTFSDIRVEISTEKEVNDVNELTIYVGKEMAIASDKGMLETYRLRSMI